MAQAQANPMQQNEMARQILLATGVPMKKMVGIAGPFSLGQMAQIQLDRVGIMTALEVEITATANIGAGGATASPYGAFSLVQNVKYTDFNSVDRVSSSGPLLYLHNSNRGAWLYNSTIGSGVAPLNPAVGEIDTNQYALPVGAGTAAGNVKCAFMVPLAYNPKSDLRGAVLAQTVVGDHYLKIQFANAAIGDAYSAPYTAAAASAAVSNIYVQVYEWYIQPQNLNAIPQIDLSTIYGIDGNYISTDNIAANQPKYINYPNNRSVLSSTHLYQNNGAFTLNGADLAKITVIANSNTNLREETPASLRRAMRLSMGGDLQSGAYILDTRSNPIATTLYGNVQVKFDVLTASGSPTQFISQFESFYPSGVPLPGVATGY